MKNHNKEMKYILGIVNHMMRDIDDLNAPKVSDITKVTIRATDYLIDRLNDCPDNEYSIMVVIMGVNFRRHCPNKELLDKIDIQKWINYISILGESSFIDDGPEFFDHIIDRIFREIPYIKSEHVLSLIHLYPKLYKFGTTIFDCALNTSIKLQYIKDHLMKLSNGEKENERFTMAQRYITNGNIGLRSFGSITHNN